MSVRKNDSSPYYDSDLVALDGDGPLVASVACCRTRGMAKANAQLIASAPDLLGTMETLVETLDADPHNVTQLLAYINLVCRAVIANAKGE